MRRALVLLGIALATLSATPAVAAPEDVANDISSRVMSPYCPGVTLHDCPSEAAARLRARIIGWAEQGMSRAEIIERLEDEFGTSVRATPPARGIGLLAWVLPAAAVIAGLGLAWLLITHWKRRAPRVAAAVSARDHERVAQALEAFRNRP
ncbi:MAG TPA: cytochrome c-type biogenesis protein CcmH [Actinomycetota bacterium]|nr:cytochrome c-type biogenesis protein CcmH [Actinomycetota bacterium]